MKLYQLQISIITINHDIVIMGWDSDFYLGHCEFVIKYGALPFLFQLAYMFLGHHFLVMNLHYSRI